MCYKFKPGDIVYTSEILGPDDGYHNDELGDMAEPEIRAYKIESIDPDGFGHHYYYARDLQDGTNTSIDEHYLYGSISEACKDLLCNEFYLKRNINELLLLLKECLYWLLKENQNAKT
jgi:hypothetical protein